MVLGWLLVLVGGYLLVREGLTAARSARWPRTDAVVLGWRPVDAVGEPATVGDPCQVLVRYQSPDGAQVQAWSADTLLARRPGGPGGPGGPATLRVSYDPDRPDRVLVGSAGRPHWRQLGQGALLLALGGVLAGYAP